jgi:Ca2+-transporting ATPase
MSKRNAVIRKLTAVETLGCTQVICSDKTGTLTQNKMTVVEDYTADRAILATAMTLCNDAEPDEDGNAVGEPTECALVNYATKHEFLKPALKAAQPRIGEVPFDSSRKMMTTVHTVDGSVMQYTKGAPDELLARCTTILTENGVVALTDELRAEVMKHNKAMADKALRVLAAAYRKLDAEPAEYTVALETDLTFAGLCGMIDPVRPEVLEAIKDCRSAGIRPIMITGDHKDTAVAIALELGIITDASQAITGAELNEISDADFEKAIEKYSVYARVQPEHKVRIVAAWKKKGMITAMTGDGVNDAPSIKTADIGIGMGITGTDVTKNVADMVLADDNFATIVYAVEEGRKIYSNIRKAIQFLLSSNMSEVITIFTAQMIGFTILEAPHLLWINLITDCFPALALGVEPGESDIMQQPPRKSNEGIFAGGLGVDLVYQGVMVSVLTLAAYIIGSLMDPAVTAWSFGVQSSHGITMAFLTMSMAEIFHSLNMRSQRGSIFTLKGRNLLLIGAMVLAFLLTTAVIEIPVLADLFGFTVIDLKEYLIALGLALTVIPVVEIVKLIQRAIKKN